MCSCVYVSRIKWKTSDHNDLELGTVVVLDSLSEPIDFGVPAVKGQGHRVIISNFWHPFIFVECMQSTEFKFCVQMHYRWLLPADQTLGWNAAGVTECNSLWKFTPTYIMHCQKMWNDFFSDTSYCGWPIVWCHPKQVCLLSWHGFASPQSAHSNYY